MTDQENTQQEPTMEEILASIRRIISEDNDEAAKTATNGATAPAQPMPTEEPAPMAAAPHNPMTNGASAPSGAEVLELTTAQALPEEEPAPAPMAAAPSYHQPEEPSVAPQPEPAAPAMETPEAPAAAAPAEEYAGSDLMLVDRDEETTGEEAQNNALVSNDVENAASAAFQSLGRSVAITEEGDGRTLEGMVQDMMQPMLKDWLDDNLADIVEDVVEREVRRISDRGRGR